MRVSRVVLVPSLLEAEYFVRGLGGALQEGPFSFPVCYLEGFNTVLVVSGVGKVNAAVCTFCMIQHFSPSEFWVVGIGGAYPDSGLRIGDLAAASLEVYGDEIFPPKEFSMTPLTDLVSGKFITLSKLPESVEEAVKLSTSEGGALVENMEGAAVAHAASRFGIVPVEVRAISNTAGIRDKSRWDVDLAMRNLVDFVRELL